VRLRVPLGLFRRLAAGRSGRTPETTPSSGGSHSRSVPDHFLVVGGASGRGDRASRSGSTGDALIERDERCVEKFGERDVAGVIGRQV